MLRRITLGGIAIAFLLVPLLAADGPAEAQMRHQRGVYVQEGKASWYGPGFRGRKTASGERFNPQRLTAAHKRLPLGTKAKVTNLHNGRTVEVEITDRGPYVRGRIIDLSRAAAERLGMKQAGTALVLLEVIELPSDEDGQSS